MLKKKKLKKLWPRTFYEKPHTVRNSYYFTLITFFVGTFLLFQRILHFYTKYFLMVISTYLHTLIKAKHTRNN
jgi:hypothetical protein